MTRKDRGGILAQFYTKREVARRLIDVLPLSSFSLIIEPSAGDGAFSSQITGCKAFDLEPKGEGIIQQDFFTLDLPTVASQTLIIGNPPFGKQASLATRFIQKSCKMADTVAFILPLSFVKKSMKDRVPLSHHLVYEEVLDENSFMFEGKPYALPCVFQIWKRADQPRVKEVTPSCDEFVFVSKKESPDIWFRRVGFYAGTFGTEVNTKSEQSHYFLKTTEKAKVMSKLEGLRWLHGNTVGARSISKYELITKYQEILIR